MSNTVMTLDVRPQIRSGREPFSLIMGAVSRLETGQRLLLIAPFEPEPLYGVMAQRGFDHLSTARDNGDWEILFTPVGDTAPEAGPDDHPPCPRAPSIKVIDLDARGLEPPEPLVRILEALVNVPDGAEIRAHTDRRPIHLYSQLTERGFLGESVEQEDGSFVTSIRQCPQRQ